MPADLSKTNPGDILDDSVSTPRSGAIDDGMTFSPWHGIAAHRPLGGVMRSRRPAYEMSSAFRGQFNGCPVHG